MVDLIFIDDCPIITQAWKLYGLSHKKNIATYNSIKSASEDIGQHKLTTPIYIDADLNDAKSGQEFAKELYDSGFINIFLATGHPSTKFPKMYWIKDIVGKLPPF